MNFNFFVMNIVTIRELVGISALYGQSDKPLMLCDKGEVWVFPRLVDISFRFGRVLLSAKTCVMAEDLYSTPTDECITPSELLRYCDQFGFADKPLAIFDNSGLGYFVTDSAHVPGWDRFVIDISICVPRRV